MRFKWVKFRTRRGKIIKFRARQTGKSKRRNDLYFSALQPGKRRSRRGRIYYEYRRNRSDMRPKKKL